jgi:hypothetical protein
MVCQAHAACVTRIFTRWRLVFPNLPKITNSFVKLLEECFYLFFLSKIKDGKSTWQTAEDSLHGIADLVRSFFLALMQLVSYRYLLLEVEKVVLPDNLTRAAYFLCDQLTIGNVRRILWCFTEWGSVWRYK